MKTIVRVSKFDYVAVKGAAKTLRAVNHKLRIKILMLIEESGRINVTEIYRKLGVPQSVASQQLAIMRAAKIVITERDGKKIFYSLNNDRIAQAAKFVTDMTGAEPLAGKPGMLESLDLASTVWNN